MRAGRFVRVGSPVEIQEVDPPTARKPDEVIVRIAGSGVCRTDLHILDGANPLQPAPEPPFTLGHENAGWVEELGPGVTSLRKGDPVILHPGITCGLCPACRAGEDMYCPRIRFPGVDGSNGGYAEFLRTSLRAVVPLAPGTDPTLLAPLADAGITAYHAVRRLVGAIDSGDVVLVLGVGGLGHLGVQLLRAMTPARVFVADTRPDRVELGLHLGAEKGFLTSDSKFAHDLKNATNGEGADVVLDFVAEQNTPELALQILRRGGTYSIVGYGGTVTVPTVTMITQEFRLLGNFVGTYRDLSELMELERQGRVEVSARKYPLTHVARAMTDLRAGNVMGRAVLVP